MKFGNRTIPSVVYPRQPQMLSFHFDSSIERKVRPSLESKRRGLITYLLKSLPIRVLAIRIRSELSEEGLAAEPNI